jgi:flavin reductase (DIM6/NTAB) family NADH-FMN oxidoreductase RutF
MTRKPIPVHSFCTRATAVWDEGWFLLTAGENRPGAFNTMTVSWGFFGTLWSRPVAQVVVRPTRHTHGFMEGADTFTLCAFAPEHRSILAYCGSHSGRDVDKVEATGLTPIDSTAVAAPGFDQAELIVECRKIYRDRFKPDRFLADDIEPHYPDKDYHDVYYGEIVAVQGTADYAAS